MFVLHDCVIQGPPIEDDRSDEDQDYVMPDSESETDDGTYESDEDVSVSHFFDPGSSSAGPAVAGGSGAPSTG